MIPAGTSLSNTEAEPTVRVRFGLAFLIVAPLGLAGAYGFLFLVKGEPSRVIPLFLAVAIPLALGFAIVFGYGLGRMMIVLSVPKSISIAPTSFIGVFRRTGWTGPSEREIRFDDVRDVGRTRVLRIPILRGRPNFRRAKPIMDSSFFYLTEPNLHRIEEVLAAQRGGDSGSKEPLRPPR